MNSKHVNYLIIFVLVLLGFAVIGSAVYSTKLLSKESDKLVQLKLENMLLDDQQTALNVAKKSLDEYRELDKIATTVLPQDKDQAKAVREIVKLSEESGIKLASITFPSSTLGSAQSKPLKSDTKVSNETQVKPVSGIPGVYEMEINIRQDPTLFISYPNFIDFLTKLEKNRRTSQVTSINVSPNNQDRSKLNINMSLKLYIKP